VLTLCAQYIYIVLLLLLRHDVLLYEITEGRMKGSQQEEGEDYRCYTN